MENKGEILDNYLAEAAVEQLATDYAGMGFGVRKDARLGDNRADLIAKKGNELIVFAVKAGQWTREERDAVKRPRKACASREACDGAP